MVPRLIPPSDGRSTRGRSMNRTKTVLMGGALLVAAILGLVLWRRQHREPPGIPKGSEVASSPEVHQAPVRLPAGRDLEAPLASTPEGRKEVAQLLGRLLGLHGTAARRSELITEPRRFARERGLFLREGRLLALAHPREVESEVIPLALDRTRSLDDRRFALHLLGVLSEAGAKNSVQTLFQLASSDEDGRLTSKATAYLNSVDLDGSYRSLYLNLCRKGVAPAFEALPYWVDNASIRTLEEVARSNTSDEFPEYGLRLKAEEALKRLATLTKPDWQDHACKFLETQEGERCWSASWALGLAKRSTSREPMLKAIRARLDGELAAERERYARVMSKNPNPVTMPSFESIYATGASFLGLSEEYDDLLVTYQELRGTASELERKRLRTFGYACDPKERLAELLNEQR